MMNGNDLLLRDATINDIPFLVETVVEAEKSGTSVLSYTTIFGLEEKDAKKYIGKMLEEESDGCELSLSSFILAELGGKIAGAVCAWFEGAEGVPSNILKGNLLSYTLPPTCLDKASHLKLIINDLHIECIPGTIQIGLVYVAPEARGKRLVHILLNNIIGRLQTKYADAKEAYIQVFGNNVPAIRSYEQSGFKMISIKDASMDKTSKYLPDASKILMRKLL